MKDKVLDFIRLRASEAPSIRRVILFGSRARKDAGDRSDYDVAVDAPGMSDTDWARWALDLREDVPTLCGLDLVRISGTLSAQLAERIREEGKEIYVKK